MRYKAMLVLLSICLALQAAALPGKTDSLKAELANALRDTDRVQLLQELSWLLPSKDSSEKISYALQSLDLAKQLRPASYLMDAYQNLARIYCYQFGNYPAAIGYFQQLESLSAKTRDTVRLGEALANLVVAFKQSAAYAKGLECGNRALRLHLSLDMRAGLLGNMGSIYLEVADYPRAMDCYTRSLKAGEEIIAAKRSAPTLSDTMQLAITTLFIGDIYGKMKEYAKAIENYDRAIALNNRRSPSFNANVIMSKGAAYEHMGRYAVAIATYQDALKINESRDHSNQAAILTSLSGLYFRTGEIRTAQHYADSALRIARKYQDKPQLTGIYIMLARLENGSRHYAPAAAYLEQATGLARELGTRETEGEALQTLSTTYSAMGRHAKALEAYQRYIAIRDTVYNVDKAKEITRMDIESQYNTFRIRDEQQAELRMQKQKAISVGAYIVAGLLLLLAGFVYRNLSLQKKTNRQISDAHKIIEEEKQVAEDLLLNILPGEIAKELKTNGDVTPQLFGDVTVMFTDFVNFTTAGARLSPGELVAELHGCFKEFDLIVSRHQVEKIKTVGDGYIAASGLPQPDPAHAANMLRAAIEIRNFMLERKRQFPETAFEIRIGIHSGPVVAGIVGVKKFAYDIWGDTVNTAARMEQSSEAGKINISEATRALLKEEFACDYRGEIEAKNKGKMKMYFVTAREITSTI